jgi:hypothetical protein
VGAQPAMVACYPRIADDAANRYARDELMRFI